jgi:hypothetical protein
MDEMGFLDQLHSAFDSERRPGNEDIVHCSYDKRWGGTLDGPCRECSEVVEYFADKGQYQHDPVQLGWVAFGLAPFTPEAFVYWLPGFLEAVVLHSRHAGGVAESLEFRFESTETEGWQQSHIGKLSRDQLDVLKTFFRLQRARNEIDEEVFGNVIETLNEFSAKNP